MNQQYDNNLRGVLFKNDRKEKDSHPDYKGSCEIDGQEMWISAWIKEGQKGKFMSLSFQPKEQQAPAPRQAQKPAPKAKGVSMDEFEDSDVPFISCAFGHDTVTSKAKKLKAYDF